MAEDYYKTLGVRRDATQEEIAKAYRDLARKFHPDKNPDDASAKKKFQTIQAAFDVLNDPKKREAYDRYGTAFENLGAGGRRSGGPWSGASGPAEGFSFDEVDLSQFFGNGGGGFSDIFSQFQNATGRKAKTAGRRGRRRGPDVEHEVTVPLPLVITGGEIQLTLAGADGSSETLAVKIPAGIEDGKKIRLRGKGEAGLNGGDRGDLLLTVHTAPHPNFVRSGNDLTVRLPVTLAEAALGAKVEVPTPRGTVAMKVPAGTSSGKKLRAKGQGISTKSGVGDLYVEILIVLPSDLDDASKELIRQIDQRHPSDPRRELRW